MTLTSVGTNTNDQSGAAIIASNTTGTNTISAPLVLGAAAGLTQTFRGVAGSTTVISGVISEANSGVELRYSDGGAWQLSGVNTYTGGTTVGVGGIPIDLRLGNEKVFGSGKLTFETTLATGMTLSTDSVDLTGSSALANPVILGGGTAQSGFTVMGGNSIEFAGSLGLSTTAGGVREIINNIGGSGKQLTLSGEVRLSDNPGLNSTLDILGSGATLVSGNITNGVAVAPKLTYSGGGSLTLSGNNTYSGLTTVNSGTLLVNGSNTGAGLVLVNSSGKLGGTGSITGAVTINSGGTLSPGASIESLSVAGALLLKTGSTFEYEVDSSFLPDVGADLQQVTGRLSLGNIVGNETVNLTMNDVANIDRAFPAGTKFTLINYAGTFNGGFFTYASTLLTEGAQFTAGLNTWQINYGADSGGSNFAGQYVSGHFINLTAIPEPGTLLALGCLVGSGAFLRSRRRGGFGTAPCDGPSLA
ncbi:MAG: autotransporter-associated beta strand repeat-containing protein [Verrucomicrobia bacterium]|nr:autotransporter-associated beta strand repeat-containing protein [Verrucomicrobiota bacterium]